MIEEADDGKEEAKAALRAAKKARSNGSPSDTAMLNAMEAAEKQHESRKAHSKAQANLSSFPKQQAVFFRVWAAVSRPLALGFPSTAPHTLLTSKGHHAACHV